MKDRSLLLLSSFSKALAHKIRTPLSVISNELSSLRAKYGSEEFELLTAKCQQIIEILKNATISGDDISKTRVPARDLLKSLKAESQDDFADWSVLINLDRLLWADSAITELGRSLDIKFSQWAGTIKNHLFIISRVAERNSREDPPSKQLEYSSFSELFVKNYNTDLILPPMIDAVLWAQSIEIKADLSDTLKIELAMERAP